jgi:hypothetical protein
MPLTAVHRLDVIEAAEESVAGEEKETCRTASTSAQNFRRSNRRLRSLEALTSAARSTCGTAPDRYPQRAPASVSPVWRGARALLSDKPRLG